MILLIIFFLGLLVVPLAAQRNDFKRMVLIALAFEPIKFLFILSMSAINSEFLSFLYVMFIYVAMLPELLFGGEFGSRTIWRWILMLSLGIVWNIIPAYFISLILPEKSRAGGIKTAEP